MALADILADFSKNCICAGIIDCGSTPGRGGIEGEYLHVPSGKSEIVLLQAKHKKPAKFAAVFRNKTLC
jgi:hypothetical protein